MGWKQQWGTRKVSIPPPDPKILDKTPSSLHIRKQQGKQSLLGRTRFLGFQVKEVETADQGAAGQEGSSGRLKKVKKNWKNGLDSSTTTTLIVM